MLFSKSFGYALRSVLYITTTESGRSRVSLEEIARTLNVPRFFLGKILKRLVKEGVLSSQKGPFGGFYLTENTLETSLATLVRCTGEPADLDTCMLRFNKCNPDHPCPLHYRAESVRHEWLQLLSETTIGDLVKEDRHAFIQSICTP
jgi:Rrf2 family transcriptional regulator, iron-sulfur cluster assembly transcription factor